MYVTRSPDLDSVAPAPPGSVQSRPSPRRSAAAGPWSLAPGLAAAAGVAAVATVLGRSAPVIGAPVFAVVLGLLVSGWLAPSPRLRAGLDFTSKRVLQGAIVVMGLGLSLSQVVSTGAGSLPVLLGTLAVGLAVAWLAGRRLGLSGDLNVLIGVGSAICGASAIAATDSVIGADEADVSYAIATVFTFNVVAVLTYPSVGHLLGLSQHAFGLWAGTAINDTSSVVAASTIYGHAAASYGTVVKLTRTLAIIPICVGLALWRNRRFAASSRATTGATERVRPAAPATFAWRRAVPLFIGGFIVAVGCNSLGLVPAGAHRGLSELATFMITGALAAIGLSTKPRQIRRAGPRPILLGGILSASIGVTSLLLQAA